jgi:hypothetical protein
MSRTKHHDIVWHLQSPKNAVQFLGDREPRQPGVSTTATLEFAKRWRDADRRERERITRTVRLDSASIDCAGSRPHSTAEWIHRTIQERLR